MLDSYLRQQIIAASLAEPPAPAAASSGAPDAPIELPNADTIASIRSQLQAYMDVDDKLRKLHAAGKELNRTKKALGEQILAFMTKYKIEDLNTKSGKLRYRVSFVKAPVSQKELKNRFMSLYDTNKTAEEISSMVFDAREKMARASLKRLSARAITDR